MKDYKKQGIKSFLKQDFVNAVFCFSEARRLNPDDKEAMVFLMLVDLAKTAKEEAFLLFNDYLSKTKTNKELKDELIDKIIEYLEEDMYLFENMLKNRFQDEILQQNTINYDEFMASVKQRGDFRQTFEDIMFSTKVVISDKDDFINFLSLLIENNFIEISLNYLESASLMFPNEQKFQSLLAKALRRQNNWK